VSPRLFAHIFTAECRKLMSYRADFWINALLGFLAHFGVMYYLWRAIYREPAAVIAGYSFEGMVLYYLLVILIGKLVRGTTHAADISQDIYEGSLSRYIVYPTSYFAFKYAQHLGLLLPALVQLVIFGLLYALVLPLPAEAHMTPLTVVMATVATLLANLLFYTMTAPLQAIAFWADNVWSLIVMQRFATSLLGGAMLPLGLFPDWSQPLLAALPFRYLYDFPVNTLMGRVAAGEWLAGLGIGLAWWLAIGAVTRLVWRRGMFSYTGVGI